MTYEFMIGFSGAIVGALASLSGIWLKHWLDNSQRSKLEDQRKSLLTQMLSIQEEPWRDLDALSKVIGASPEETKRLLFEIGARGSETKNDVWALMRHKPLRTQKLD